MPVEKFKKEQLSSIQSDLCKSIVEIIDENKGKGHPLRVLFKTSCREQ